MTQYKYLLEEREMPTHWYNILADMKNPPPPYRHPGTLEVMGPDDHAAARLSDGADRPRSSARSARSRFPTRCKTSSRCGVRRPSTAPRAGKRCSTRRPRSITSGKASALQAATSPTPPSPRPTMPSRRASKAWPPRPAPASGAARSAFATKLFDLKMQGLYGHHQLPPETLPPHHDGDLGRQRGAQPQHRRPTPGARSWPKTPRPRAAWASPSARRSSTPSPTMAGSTRWAAWSTLCCCTRP